MSKSVTQKLKEAKERIISLEKELKNVQEDRKKYQDWMISDFKHYIQMAGKNQYWSSDHMIEKITRRLQQANSFWWT